jgi:hypothetical protein
VSCSLMLMLLTGAVAVACTFWLNKAAARR